MRSWLNKVWSAFSRSIETESYHTGSSLRYSSKVMHQQARESSKVMQIRKEQTRESERNSELI